MIPGSVSKLSEATVASADKIFAKADIVYVSGSTTINTIVPGLGTAQSQFLMIVSTDGAITLGTAGNIAVGLATIQNRACVLMFSKKLGKWVIGM